MHANSLRLMREFVQEYDLHDKAVVDIGSLDVNGSYRELFDGCYIGVDMTHGKNVDVLYGSPSWYAIRADAALCGQVLEHVEDRVGLLASIKEVLKPGGLLCAIAPGVWKRHDYPIYTGKLTVNRMLIATEAAGFSTIRCWRDVGSELQDICCIARKPS